MVKKYFFTLFFIITFFRLYAQENLSLTQAIDIALKNNYSITISKNDVEIATNNNKIGNAGMLPSIDLNGAPSKSINNTRQNNANGLEVNRNGF